MSEEIEKLAVESGLIEYTDSWETLPEAYRTAIETFYYLVKQQVINAKL